MAEYDLDTSLAPAEDSAQGWTIFLPAGAFLGGQKKFAEVGWSWRTQMCLRLCPSFFLIRGSWGWGTS